MMLQKKRCGEGGGGVVDDDDDRTVRIFLFLKKAALVTVAIIELS